MTDLNTRPLLREDNAPGSFDAEAAGLIAAAVDRQEARRFSPAMHARILRGVLQKRRTPFGLNRLRFAFVVVSLLTLCGGAVAGYIVVPRWVATRVPTPAIYPLHPTHKFKYEERKSEPSRPSAPAIPETAAPVISKAPPRRLANAAPRMIGEYQLLSSAQKAARIEKNPSEALNLVEKYFKEFDNGQLRPEAVLLQLEALLTLGRTAEALNIAQSLDLRNAPSELPLRMIRAELRIQRKQCVQAQEDLQEVIARASSPDLLSRGLYGRGVCRSLAGDLDGARADLGRVADDYPTSAVAAQAVRALNEVP